MLWRQAFSNTEDLYPRGELTSSSSANIDAAFRTFVEPRNDNPLAIDDSAETQPGVTVTVPILNNDTDPDGDALVIKAVSVPGSGEAVAINDDEIRYTPDDNFTGEDSFTYTVTDGNGGTAEATVTVTVGQANNSPNPSDDSARTTAGAAVTIDVLANDSDPGGNTLSIQSVGDPMNGDTVVTNDSEIRYTPADGFTGTDSFAYTVNDGNGGTDTASVDVTVEPSDSDGTDAQARVFLKSGADFTIASPAEVFGRSGSDETLRFTDNAENVILDGNIENLQVPDRMSETTFQITDGQLNIGANGDRIITFFAGLNQDVRVTFANDEGTLQQTVPASNTVSGPDGSIEIGTDPVTPVGVGMMEVDAI